MAVQAGNSGSSPSNRGSLKNIKASGSVKVPPSAPIQAASSAVRNAISGARGAVGSIFPQLAPKAAPKTTSVSTPTWDTKWRTADAPYGSVMRSVLGGTGTGTGTPVWDGSSPVDTSSYTSFDPSGSGDYLAQIGALDAALKKYEADYAANTGNYNVDYNQGMTNLGWKWNVPSYQDISYDPNSGKWSSGVGAAATEISTPGEFSQEDVNTASGRAYQNQLNDFAARGMLRSSDFNDAKRALDRSLLSQAGSMVTGRQRYLSDLERQRNAFLAEDKAAREAAKTGSTSSYINSLFGG